MATGKINYKEFKPTSWAIDNKTTIYVLIVIITLFGMISYNRIPKEQFPEIVIPQIIVSTIYPGSSPSDIEKLISRPLEKNIKSISGVKHIKSNSVQDFSSIIVEFVTGIDVAEAKQKVKDAVDKTKSDLPNNLPQDPSVMEIDLSEIPIMFITMSGDYSLDKLKTYGEMAQDRIESLPEITRVDIVGALDREIQINVDMFKLQAHGATFSDIERAIASENITISGGTIDLGGKKRAIKVSGEFRNMEQIKSVIFKTSSGAVVKLGDIAEVVDGFKEQESFSRLNGKNAITLNVVKKSGQNLLNAADQIKNIIDDLQENKYPKDISISIVGDQSKFTRNTLADLNNTIIIGFILVLIVLMFFMGLTNAFFVALSVPLSMFIAYIVLPGFDFTMNMLVMFSFIFALGIVVDDAIVVIENTHRIFRQKHLPISRAAKVAAGEVFVPILSGTLTTIAPFFPLLFWPGVVGNFMFYIPVVIILALFASLFVAYIINPVFAVSFMKHDSETKQSSKKKIFKNTIIIFSLGILFLLIKQKAVGNFTLFFAIMYLLHNFYGFKILNRFQNRFIPAIMRRYEKLLKWTLHKRRPYYFLVSLIVLFFGTIYLTAVTKPSVVFFPDNQPNSFIVYIKLPVGAEVRTTDSIAKLIEKDVNSILGKDNPIVESIITNVALGASESQFDSRTITSNKAKVSVNFVEFSKRKGQSTQKYMDEVRDKLKAVSGAEIWVEKNKMGPPTGKPINIEVSGEDIDLIIDASRKFLKFLDSLKIPGVEKLKSDFEMGKPEIVIDIDHERANREGLTSAQIGSEIRTAVLGKEISKYRDGEDQFPIQLRYSKLDRSNIDRLMNLKITYRDMTSGLLRSIPLSTVAKIKYINTYGGINRKDIKRMITISSNVLTGYTPNEIVAKIENYLKQFPKSDDYDIKLTGEKEDQKETSDFLGVAMMLSICLILFILINQFNSISKPIIILSEIVFSLIGVLLGFIITGMPISIVLTGMGIVALAGIVVRNGILLVEFTDVLKEQGMKTREAIIGAGKTRITPVLLTAATTILGLIPLAIGFNIDFEGLLTHFEPHIFFGGDSVMFFGPLAWSIIFGLGFATFLTLVFIPVMYFVVYTFKLKVMKAFGKKKK